MTTEFNERLGQFLAKLRTYAGYVVGADFWADNPGIAVKEVKIQAMSTNIRLSPRCHSALPGAGTVSLYMGKYLIHDIWCPSRANRNLLCYNDPPWGIHAHIPSLSAPGVVLRGYRVHARKYCHISAQRLSTESSA